MNEVLYHLPHGGKLTKAFLLYEREGLALLFVPPVEHVRGATLTIADRLDFGAVYQDSPANSFPIRDWGTAATITIFLMLIMKESLIEKPTKLS